MIKPTFYLLFMLIFNIQCWAATILQDGFESGDLSSPVGTGSWGASNAGTNDSVSVSSLEPHVGMYSLRFLFYGDYPSDAWAEQRADFGSQYSEIWGRLYVYIPENYLHAATSPNNNKFWAVYASPYTSPGFQINLSTARISDTQSALVLHIYDDGIEQTPLSPDNDFINSGDFGTWLEIIVHVKVPANTSSSDGIIEVWKNGAKVADYDNLDIYGSAGRNYIDEMYLLGWSNSGFVDTTIFYIDDVLISDTQIGSDPTISLTGTCTGTIR